MIGTLAMKRLGNQIIIISLSLIVITDTSVSVTEVSSLPERTDNEPSS